MSQRQDIVGNKFIGGKCLLTAEEQGLHFAPMLVPAHVVRRDDEPRNGRTRPSSSGGPREQHVAHAAQRADVAGEPPHLMCVWERERERENGAGDVPTVPVQGLNMPPIFLV